MAALTKAEREKAAKISVYIVWYRDNFSHEGPWAVYLCQKKSDAEKKVAERPIEKNPSWDGYDMTGPHNLLEAYEKGMLNDANTSAEELVRIALKG